jgi:SAM-dependent methyltransferase
VQELDWKQAIRNILVLLRDYARGLALLTKRPRLAQELHDCERQLEELMSNLARERGEDRRLEKQRKRRLPVGKVRFGDLRRRKPISRRFGFDRGQAIDRYYIENFLARHADDVRGRVLEIGDNFYTRKFGGSRVEISDVLHVTEGNPQATIVADLTRADHVPSDAFDCIIFTQTLQFIYDVRSAIRTLYRILKPGGILLATFPGIGRMLDPSQEKWDVHYHWAFTLPSVRRLFEEAFPTSNFEVEAHGNVLAAISFLHGLAVEELRQEELDHREADYDGYEVLIALRAVKPEATL